MARPSFRLEGRESPSRALSPAYVARGINETHPEGVPKAEADRYSRTRADDFFGDFGWRSDLNGSLLPQVPHQARNEGRKADHDEEWQTCHARHLPGLRHEDVQDWSRQHLGIEGRLPRIASNRERRQPRRSTPGSMTPCRIISAVLRSDNRCYVLTAAGRCESRTGGATAGRLSVVH
jgi:hypothetical protein